MPQIVKDFQGKAVITTFDIPPALAFDPAVAPEAACRDCISRQPGLIAAGPYMRDVRTRACNYSQWRPREDYRAMLRTPEMRERNRKINEPCRGFGPMMHEVTGVF